MSHFARPIRNLEEQRKQLPYGFCGISNPQPPPAVARAHKYAVLQYASNRLRRGKARRLRNRAGSAMFLKLRFGADNGGGVKGRREVCGFKKPPPVETGAQGYPWVACAGMGSSRKFRMYFCGVSMFLGKSDFPLVGSLSRRYCRGKPHQPARKECAAPPARVKFYD